MRSALSLYAGLTDAIRDRVSEWVAVVANIAQKARRQRLREALARRARSRARRELPLGELDLALVRFRMVFQAFPDFVGVQLVRLWRNVCPTTRPLAVLRRWWQRLAALLGLPGHIRRCCCHPIVALAFMGTARMTCAWC